MNVIWRTCPANSFVKIPRAPFNVLVVQGTDLTMTRRLVKVIKKKVSFFSFVNHLDHLVSAQTLDIH